MGTNELVERLKRGRNMASEEGVNSDFECAWRTAAFQHAKELQPSLSVARQHLLFDALELANSGDDHKGHTHPPCQHENLQFEELSWKPIPTSLETEKKSMAVLVVESAEELVEALEAVKNSPDPTRIAMKAGTYRLNETMLLGAGHSGIVIGPEKPGDEVVLSGNRLISGLKWSPASNKIKGVWATQVPKDVEEIVALRVNGLRATRARYPNANPEFDQFPTGYILDKTTWTPPVFPNGKFGESVKIHLPNVYPTVDTPTTSQIPNDGYGPDHFAGAYRMGFGGACSKLTPPQSYWCQPEGRTQETYLVRSPSGIQNITQHLPHGPYKSHGTDMVLTYWRPGHWFSVMYAMNASGIDQKTGDVTFGIGGFQGAEGHDTGAEWFVENIEEELDSANEFWFDAATSTLYLFYNGTGIPPPSVEVPILNELISLQGGLDAPVEKVVIHDVMFTGTRPAYLEPHGTPSAGDWGMTRLAAIHAKGTKGLDINSCHFDRLDGNAILLDGYNRNASITDNEFALLGASGIVLWGYEHYGDGTGGEQPRMTSVMSNFCHEIGIYQKQSSCYFHAVSAQSTIQNNLFFNGPRAMVNFNDNFGGGHDLGHNLIFNTCRESSDHGAFNSWGREPYMTDVPPGPPSAEPLYSRLHNNFIVANYAADGGCYDNDDGSSWYLEQNNFCVYGGMKSDFQGHGKRSSNNIHAYASVYGDACLVGEVQVSEHYAEGYWNNTCILTKAGDPYMKMNCLMKDSNSQHTYFGHNKIYVPGGQPIVSYCGTNMNFSAWMAVGLDLGTTVADSAFLSTSEIISMGMEVLQGPNGPSTPVA